MLAVIFCILGYGFWISPDFKEIAAGVAIFLFGMMSLENGFKTFTGGLLEKLLKRTTDRLWKSLSFGVITTSLMQSSSLISIITISFLSAGLITLTAGIGIIFGGRSLTQYKVGVLDNGKYESMSQAHALISSLKAMKYIDVIMMGTLDTGLEKLKRHQIDLLLAPGATSHRYWVADTSPKGYVAEHLLRSSFIDPQDIGLIAESIKGRAIRYVDWLLPGVLAMNIMFSALWGVGYVVVRYRKIGVLKRLMTTPLTALEYLLAQMVSRMCILMVSTAVVWMGCDLIFDFQVEGSYGDLVIAFVAGGLSLTSLGLLLASRGISEEMTTGILNFISWPMMFLSEVWFSLEGAPQWVRFIAQLFPLAHMIRAVRAVMQDGARMAEIFPQLLVLTVFSTLFLLLGSLLFSWNK